MWAHCSRRRGRATSNARFIATFFYAWALKKKASELERYSRDFVGGFALWRCRNSIGRYSAVSKREFRSQFSLFPLYGSGFAVPSFQLHPVSLATPYSSAADCP